VLKQILKNSTYLSGFFRFSFEIKSHFTKTPNIAEVDITDNCNLKCIHCYHFGGKDVFNKKELPLELWKKRFIELYKSGIRSILLVGGEPALRPDILMMADTIFPFIDVITNGVIKVPDKFNRRLFVSVDGKPETNDKIRGRGVFSKIVNIFSAEMVTVDAF